MFSNEIITFLNKYCDESDEIFTDGGTNYIFKFGRKLAHYLQEKHNMHMDFSKELNQIHLNQLQLFLDKSHGGFNNEIPSENAKKSCASLLRLLQDDIKYDYIYITDYDSDDYSSELKIVMIKGNDYYSLELMWGMD